MGVLVGRLDDRDGTVDALYRCQSHAFAEDVVVLHPDHRGQPVHTLPLYTGYDRDALTVTEVAAARQLSLPCYPAMTDIDVDRVITALHDLGDGRWLEVPDHAASLLR